MNITSTTFSPISKANLRRYLTADKPANFKEVNSGNILNAMNIKSLSQKAQVSFCAKDSEIKWEDALIEIINDTPDDKIDSPIYYYDHHFGARTYILLVNAAEIGSSKAIELLRLRGANPNIVDSQDNSALMKAAQYGQAEAIKALRKFENIDINQANKYGETALMRAVEYGQPEAVKALLEFENIDLNHTDNIGDTALSRAKMYKNNEIIEMLES